MTERKQAVIWEVLAKTGTAPTKAVLLFADQGVAITLDRAKAELAAAKRRNTLRLVEAGGLARQAEADAADPTAVALRSTWGRRIRR